jgi:hypothetical protein
VGSGTGDLKKRRNSPSLEALEGRIVLSTFHAGTAAELRADIAQVNNTSGPNTIVLAAGTYSLPSELKIQNAGNLTIQSIPGKGAVNLVGSAVDRVLEIDGGNVTLTGLSISGGGGVGQGAGILSQNATVSVVNSKIFGNVSRQAGAGIFALGGTLKVQNSSIMNNRASNSSLAFGGGIVSWGAGTTITGSTVSENSVYAVDTKAVGSSVYGTGAGIYAQAGTLNITSSTVSGNLIYSVTTGVSGGSAGAGVATYQTAVTVANSAFTYNALNTVSFGAPLVQGSTFSTTGGSLKVSNSKLNKNTPGRWRNFSHPGATVTLQNTTIDGKKFVGTRTL